MTKHREPAGNPAQTGLPRKVLLPDSTSKAQETIQLWPKGPGYVWSWLEDMMLFMWCWFCNYEEWGGDRSLCRVLENHWDQTMARERGNLCYRQLGWRSKVPKFNGAQMILPQPHMPYMELESLLFFFSWISLLLWSHLSFLFSLTLLWNVNGLPHAITCWKHNFLL